MSDNPTTQIVNSLVNVGLNNATFNVLDTAIEAVNEFYLKTNNVGDNKVYCLHLGVSSKATCFNLENCAYNTMDFRVPDESGNQPSNAVIEESCDLENVRSTSFPVSNFCDKLRDKGYEVCKSTDPGRFLCNYVYYSTLMRCHNSQAIFVHVPPVEVVPLEVQVNFVRDFIHMLLEYASESEGGHS